MVAREQSLLCHGFAAAGGYTSKTPTWRGVILAGNNSMLCLCCVDHATVCSSSHFPFHWYVYLGSKITYAAKQV